MFTRFDLIQPVSSVTVTTSRNNDLVKIEFARCLDIDVMADMQGVRFQPFVRFFHLFSNQKTFDITINSNYSLEEVAELIAQNLEDHKMTVGRLSGLVEKSELKSFTAQ